jgi:hypothetical protein
MGAKRGLPHKRTKKKFVSGTVGGGGVPKRTFWPLEGAWRRGGGKDLISMIFRKGHFLWETKYSFYFLKLHKFALSNVPWKTKDFWHLHILGLLYRMTLRTEPSERDVRTRFAVFRNVDLGTRYVTACVLQEGVGGGKLSAVFLQPIQNCGLYGTEEWFYKEPCFP